MRPLPEKNRGFAMRVGQDAIVFLSYSDWRLDTLYDYFQLKLYGGTARELPVINGQVRDVNRIWSDSETVSYTDWRRRFMDIREKILSGTY
jgi:hypothetical protein